MNPRTWIAGLGFVLASLARGLGFTSEAPGVGPGAGRPNRLQRRRGGNFRRRFHKYAGKPTVW